MENRKKLLHGVSAVAIAAGLGVAAVAGTPADPVAQVPAQGQIAAATPRAADALVELMMRAGDPLTPAAMTQAVQSIYGQLTPEQVDGLPALIRGLRGLGLASDVEAAAADTLVELVATSGLPLDDRQVEALAAALSAEPETFQVADGTGRASDRGKEKGKGGGKGQYSG